MTRFAEATDEFVRSIPEGKDLMVGYLEAHALARPDAEQPRLVHTVLGYHRRYGFSAVETFSREELVAMTEALSQEAGPDPEPPTPSGP